MLTDLGSEVFAYLKGAIALLVIFHFFNFFRSKDKKYLYYSLYFFSFFLFFFKYSFFDDINKSFSYFDPSIHFITFIFYIQFAKELLNTKIKIPEWHKVLTVVQKLLLISIAITSVLHILFGFEAQKVFFYCFSPLFAVFSIITYYKFLKLKTYTSKYFVVASLLYFLFANFAFFAQLFYTIEGFIFKFEIHPTLFVYLGVLFEAFVFAYLLGHETKLIKIKHDKLEKEKELIEKKFSNYRINNTKQDIVLNNGRKIELSSILYIKSSDHFLNFNVKQDKTIRVRGKLKAVKQKLPDNFAQCHRSFIINIDHVLQFNRNSLILENNTIVPISKTYSTHFFKYNSR